MKKLCETCEAAIVAGTVRQDPVLAAHLAECPECREFSAFQERLLTAAPRLPEKTPELSAILAEKARREAAHRRTVRLVAWPLSLAAAACVAVAGLTFTLDRTPLPAVAAPAPAAGLYEAAMEETWSGGSLDLAWDAASECESSCRATLAAVRQGSETWNIETFNPFEEEMEI